MLIATLWSGLVALITVVAMWALVGSGFAIGVDTTRKRIQPLWNKACEGTKNRLAALRDARQDARQQTHEREPIVIPADQVRQFNPSPA